VKNPNKRRLLVSDQFKQELRKAIPDPDIHDDVWKAAVHFFTWLAHLGNQITDDEANYDVWYWRILQPGSNKFITIFYYYDSKIVRLHSSVVSTE